VNVSALTGSDIVKSRHLTRLLTLALVTLFAAAAVPDAVAQFKAAPEGGFPPPQGQVAFVRDGNLWLMNADGSNAREVVVSGRLANKVVWAPDNMEILYCQSGVMNYELPGGGGGAIKLYDIFNSSLDNPQIIKPTTQDAQSSSPAFFPDGKLIAYMVNLHSFDVHAELPNYQVFVAGVTGSPSAKPLNKGKITPKFQLMTPAVSPDGSTIAACVTDEEAIASPTQVIGIAFFPATGFSSGTPDEWKEKAKAIPIAFGPSYSPDGRFMAFADGTTRPRSLALWEVERGVKRTIYTPALGYEVNTTAPSWSPDGNWLVFANGKGNVMLIDRNGKNLKPLTAQGTDAFPAFSN